MDVPIKYKTFSNQSELFSFVSERTPERFEIGPIFNEPVNEINEYNINTTMQPSKDPKCKPCEKEFTIDIDMDEFDDMRTCCKGKKIC